MKFLLLIFCCGSFALKVNFHEATGNCNDGFTQLKDCDIEDTTGGRVGWTPEFSQQSSATGCATICNKFYDSWIGADFEDGWGDGDNQGGDGASDDYTVGPAGGHTYSAAVDGKTTSRGCCTWNSELEVCKAYFLLKKDVALSANYGISLVDAEENDYSVLMTDACATSLGGDPHIVNVKGESFDILQSGTFSILSLLPKTFGLVSRNPLLHVDVDIARINHECSEAYIQKATLTGSWITEMGYKLIQIRGNLDFVEVKLNDTWSPASVITSTSLNTSSSKLLHIKIHKVKMVIDINNYNKATAYDAQATVHKLGWSFLNIRFFGIKKLNAQDDVDVQGLLGNDDYHSAAKMPENCLQYLGKKDEMSNQFLSKLRLH